MKTTLQQPLLRVLLALCEGANTPRSLGVWLRAKHSVLYEVDGLFFMKTRPSDYLNAHSYRLDNACTEFLRKLNLDDSSAKRSRRAQALSSFWKSEHECARTNVRLNRLRDNHSLSSLDTHAQDLLERARWFISRTLGSLPDDLPGRFGTGATYSDKGQLTTVADKISSALSYTKGAIPLLPFVERTAWFRSLVYRQPSKVHDEVRGNRFTTVPKTSLTDRGICVEPSVNVFLQLSVGSLIKKRFLRRWGHDLLHAQDIHRSLAAKASRDGKHATIDLESASDTVSVSLVAYLLPTEWLDLLTCLRCGTTQIDGKTVILEKFSSMGNGYTFELETLIFASLAYACGAGDFGRDFYVFGDDIIVPTEVSSDLLALLRYCGFIPNQNKTFVSGPFRESCGGDYFNGALVRAHNCETDPSAPEDWISMANGLRRLGHTDPGCDFRDSFPFRAWLRCLDNLPVGIRRLRGPSSLGDLVINDDDKWSIRTRSGRQYIRVYRPIARFVSFKYFKPSVVYAAVLYGIDTRGIPTRGVSGYKVGWISHLG